MRACVCWFCSSRCPRLLLATLFRTCTCFGPGVSCPVFFVGVIFHCVDALQIVHHWRERDPGVLYRGVFPRGGMVLSEAVVALLPLFVFSSTLLFCSRRHHR